LGLEFIPAENATTAKFLVADTFRSLTETDMTQMTFYPIGCADTSLIELQDGRRMLVDYANKRSNEDGDKRCDLPTLLKLDLETAGRTSYSVVAFTHLDVDHCKGSSEFFHLEHAKEYQGGGRHKIETLWVPAAAITEENIDGDARVIRQEARHRLKTGSGIRVFSRPERLKDLLESWNLTIDSRRDCFVDAGTLVGGFSLATDGVEFFAHSPHAKRSNDRGIEDRNGDSMVFQARFQEGGYNTDVLFSGDVTYSELAEIVDITRFHGNDDRLHWNVYHLPHHCSYTALGPDKGDDKTEPVHQVAWLCETQGERNGFIISPSKPIPYKGTPEDEDPLPPHRQAAEYYQSEVLSARRNLLVTMSEPSSFNPRPIVLQVTSYGAVKVPHGSGGSKVAAAVTAPRAG
jgi:hypothetical protein